MKFDNIINIFEKDLFKAATAADIRDRLEKAERMEHDDIMKILIPFEQKYGKIDNGDYIVPLRGHYAYVFKIAEFNRNNIPKSEIYWTANPKLSKIHGSIEFRQKLGRIHSWVYTPTGTTNMFDGAQYKLIKKDDFNRWLRE